MGGRMILFLLILGTSFSVSAQMIDLMGSMAVDGMMTTQSVKGYNTANLQLKKNKIAQELQIKNIHFQTLMLSNPQNVSRETFSVAGYPASVKMEADGGLSITIKQVEKNLADALEKNFAGAKKIEKSQNTVKFYY